MNNLESVQKLKTPSSTFTTAPSGILQRKCACGAHTVAGGKCEDCKNKQGVLQRKSSDNSEQKEVPPIVNEVLQSSGQPLDESTRAFFESRFAHNFSSVPINSASPQLSQSGLTIGEPKDVYEQEADHIADSIMRTGKANTLSVSEQQGGKLDLSRVRVHTDARAAQSAHTINALAYTLGNNIVFGAGQFAPWTQRGQHLLAHELTHVIQQGAASHIDGGEKKSLPLMKQSSLERKTRGQIIQRAPLEILPADFIGPPSDNQRRAAASCGINCDGTSLGALHAMPIFFHASRGAPLAGSAGADGIGTSLHFIRNGTAAPKGSACEICSAFKIIQVINSNEPADSRGKESFVDNASSATPFYGDVGASGTGLHRIPAGYSDGGSDVQSSHSIYDRPYRPASRLGIVRGKNFFWNAEACVTCVKAGKDKVLGCATYGFKRDWDAAKSAHGPVQSVGPGCLASPSSHFVTTLRSDTSTSSYDFET